MFLARVAREQRVDDRVAAQVTMFENASLGALPEVLYYPRDLQAEASAA